MSNKNPSPRPKLLLDGNKPGQGTAPNVSQKKSLKSKVMVQGSGSSLALSDGDKQAHLTAKSAPLPESPAEKLVVKEQLSAPSYLLSLKDNGAAPFLKPGSPPKPCVMIKVNAVMTKEEAILMVSAATAADEGELVRFLRKLLVEKHIVQNHQLIEKDYLIRLIKELTRKAAQHDFSSTKLAALVSIYMKTHLYFKSYYWRTPTEVWNFFKEILIRNTIEDPPISQECFEPEESYDLLTHFHSIYLCNLPLIHALSFSSHRIKFLFPIRAVKK